MSTIICRNGVSTGASLIGRALELPRVNGEAAHRRRARTIVNWGCHSLTKRDNQRVFNLPEAVSVSSDKRLSFHYLLDGGVRIPRFVLNNPQSLRTTRDSIVLARTLPNASQGRGIEVVRRNDPFPPAPLYVEYIKKLREYRVHVAFGRAILVVEKRKRIGAEPEGNAALIRNHGDDWVFCEHDLNCDSDGTRPQLEETAVAAITAIGLHFGAVDIIKARDSGEYYVLETNSKPGVESTATLTAYVTALRERITA